MPGDRYTRPSDKPVSTTVPVGRCRDVRADTADRSSNPVRLAQAVVMSRTTKEPNMATTWVGREIGVAEERSAGTPARSPLSP